MLNVVYKKTKKMLRKIFIVVLIFTGLYLNAQNTFKQKQNLYPIIENGLWGYINSFGEEIITPQFRSAGQFSEGLASVRLQGTYGFIDKHGSFVIKPKYDMAYSFVNGLAKVYINSKPYLIDKKGKKLFEHNYAEIFNTNEKNLLITRNKNDKYGLIDYKGKQILSNVYDHIKAFSSGLAIIIKKKNSRSEDKGNIREYAVINTNGDFVVPFGKFDNIGDFKDGYAQVEFNLDAFPDIEEHNGFIDTNGNLKFTIPYKTWHLSYNTVGFSEKLATIDIYSVDPDTIKVWSSTKRYDYTGVIDTNGKILFSNKEWDDITPFKNGVAFAQDINGNYFLINIRGEVLNKKPYKNILYGNIRKKPEELFKDGVEFVKTEQGWGAIDPKGEFVITPKTFDFEFDYVSRSGKTLIFHQDISAVSDKYSYQYGFWDIESNTTVKPQYHNFRFLKESDLIYVIKDGVSGYINKQGKNIWKEHHTQNKGKKKLNIDYMNRGYFYASSPYKKELAGYDGWGTSENSYKKVKNIDIVESNKLVVYVDPKQKSLYQKSYYGIKLYIANTIKDTIYFNAQDSRLYLKLQAKDKSGEWRDIEYLPSSWCGNSYHSLFLPTNYYWEFTIPVYEGEFKTLLRAELLYKNDKKSKSIPIYSNTFEGSINPGQFWRKKTYHTSGLMDPYND